MTVQKLFEHDEPQLDALYQQIRALCYDRGNGIPIVSIVGILHMLQYEITIQAFEE